MSGKTKVLFLICLVVFLASPAFERASAPGTSVYLKASFRDANGGSGILPDKLRSDGKGSYQNAKNVTVMINGDGELVFEIGKQSGRRVNLIFDYYLRPGSCAEKPPDTAGTEPANYAHFHTHMEWYMAEPKVNPLEMQVGEIREIRFWVVFTTAVRSYFYLNYDQDILDTASGFVMIEAKDMTGDGIVDRWVLYPKPETLDMANLHRESFTGKNRNVCDLGDFRMPFELTLDRL